MPHKACRPLAATRLEGRSSPTGPAFRALARLCVPFDAHQQCLETRALCLTHTEAPLPSRHRAFARVPVLLCLECSALALLVKSLFTAQPTGRSAKHPIPSLLVNDLLLPTGSQHFSSSVISVSHGFLFLFHSQLCENGSGILMVLSRIRFLCLK